MGERGGRAERLRLVEGRGHADRATDADEAFVRALWEEHADALLAYTTRLTRDRGRAEDIVQEVMVRAWRHADHLDGRARSMRPWLFTVASHLVTDGQRARRARPWEVGDQGLDRRPGGDEIGRAVQAWAVADALRALSPQHREVLLETHYRGRSIVKAAAVLGIPAGTVKSRTYYALRALRLALEEQGWLP